MQRSQVAKAVAKGLLESRAYKDLAGWVELVLGAVTLQGSKKQTGACLSRFLICFHGSHLFPTYRSGILVAAAEASSHNPRQKQSLHPRASLFKQHRPKSQHPNMPKTWLARRRRYPASDTCNIFEQHSFTPSGQGGPRKPQQPHYAETLNRKCCRTSFRSSGPAGRRKHIESGTRAGFDYAGALRETFNRPGCTEFDDEDEFETDDIRSATVRNHQRRKERLAAGYWERINDEPTPDERRRVTEQSLLEGPNEAVRVSLYEWYRGKCQICGETWPKQDGDPYFAAAYLVERRHARWLDDPGNAICLCAKHFAQWRHAAKEMPLDVGEQIHSLRLHAEGGNGELSIDFTLLGKMSPSPTMNAICWR